MNSFVSRSCGAVLALALTPSLLPAQRTVSTAIDGFNGVAWGSSYEAVEERFGTALRSDTLDNGIIVLSYRETVLDRPARTMYAILPDKGLVKGQHMVAMDLDAGDCEGQYRRLRDYVMFTFPLIAPVENTEYPPQLDLCEAIRAGAGVWATQWIDRSTNSVATVIVEEESTDVKLIFKSGLFLEWLGVTLPPEEEEG